MEKMESRLRVSSRNDRPRDWVSWMQLEVYSGRMDSDLRGVIGETLEDGQTPKFDGGSPQGDI